MLELEKPFYPIVYVRGYAGTASAREHTFNDAYYGFANSAVAKRQTRDGYAVDIFEGQLMKFLKLPTRPYMDVTNHPFGDEHPLNDGQNPTRSLWILRFYDQEVAEERTDARHILDHALELRRLVCEVIPQSLFQAGVNTGAWVDGSFKVSPEFKVILIAHSMGGLICRTLVQNILPGAGSDPTSLIYKMVTLGTPHQGIDMAKVPAVLQDLLMSSFDLAGSAIFRPGEMRSYLQLAENEPLHSLGGKFPASRCLCIIGSDHNSYIDDSVSKVTRFFSGDASDGLVKQSHAFVVADADASVASYTAHVHRAHSGRRGIVNSFESFENMRRFLFGNVKVSIELHHLVVLNKVPDNEKAFYDIEFLLSIKGSQTYLNRREQIPCDNAIRLHDNIPERIELHTLFLNKRLRLDRTSLSLYFMMTLRVVERRVKEGYLWDHEYPAVASQRLV